jgi:dephospho-CoA kinase
VVIVDGSAEKAAAVVRARFRDGDRVLCFQEELSLYDGCNPLAYGSEAAPDTLSAGLFAALRELDDPTIGTLYARCPVGGGITYAIRNRLEKAAGFCRINPREKHCTIGITGGTGCGKTTLLNAIRQMGGFVIDCDEVYHWLLERDEYLLNNIADAFPGTVENGVLDRKKLGNIVFRDEKALQELNFITHSAVRQEVLRRLPFQPTLVAIDAIGLFEGKLASLCDVTVAVTAPEDARVARLMARDGISEEYARKRIAAQHSDDWFREQCTYTLENDGTQAAFERKCVAFLRQFGIME